MIKQRFIKDLATVITNLMSAIPWIGNDFVESINILNSILPIILNEFLLDPDIYNFNIIPVIIYDNVKTLKDKIIKENNKKIGIYQFTNKNNNKIYIGSSIDLGRRFRIHLNNSKNSSMLIHRAFLSHGYSSFFLSILEYIDISNLSKKDAKNLILAREQHYLNTLKPEYNLLKIAGSLLGFKHSENTKNNMRVPKNLDHKFKIAESLKGYKHLEGTKEKIKASLLKGEFTHPNSTIIEVTDIESISITRYDSFRKAAIELNTDHERIKRYAESQKLLFDKYFISLGENNNSYALKIAKNLKDLLDSEKTKENIRICNREDLALGHKAISIKVTDLETKVETLYESIRKAAKELNTDPKTVRKYVKSQKILFSRYFISFKGNTIQDNTILRNESGSNQIDSIKNRGRAEVTIAREGFLPTIGIVSPHALKKGKKIRSDKSEFLSIPPSFLAMLVGFIDGDGFILVHKTAKGYIKINLVISLDIKDLSLLYFIHSILGIGKINVYPKTKNPDTCKLVINRTDLQEVLFPLLIHHNIYFLIEARREQFNKVMYILQNDIKLYSEIPGIIPTIHPLPKTALGYTNLTFFNNWIVGFTVAEGSFLIKSNNDACFQLKQRTDELLFDAFKLVFKSSRKIGLEKSSYNSFSISSKSGVQEVINFFSFSGNHPLIGNKLIQYEKWLISLKDSKRYAFLKFPK